MGHVKKMVLLQTMLLLGLPGPVQVALADDACEGSVRTSPPVACGETTIVGNRPGGVRVRVPQPVTFDAEAFDGTGDITIEGTGPFVGFAIRGVEGTPTADVYLLGGRLPSGAADRDLFYDANDDGCTGEAPGCSLSATLESGDYVFHLLTGAGEPAEVTFTFEEFSGGVSLEPSIPTSFQARDLPQTLSGSGVAYAAGSYFDIPEPGRSSLLVVQWHAMQEARVFARGVCVTRREESVPDAAQFHPGCENAYVGGWGGLTSTGWSYDPLNPIPWTHQVQWFTPARVAGDSSELGLGAWYAYSGSSHEVRSIGVVVDVG